MIKNIISTFKESRLPKSEKRFIAFTIFVFTAIAFSIILNGTDNLISKLFFAFLAWGSFTILSDDLELPKKIFYTFIRTLGFIGIGFFGVGLVISIDSIENKEIFSVLKIFYSGTDQFILIGFIISIFIFIFGELLMFSFKSNLSRKLMTCPRCYGKGFVDLHDLERLGMEEKWGQGYCRYCDGEGKVKMGKTKELNPLDTQIGPGIHESDFID